jgi:hypothetical protein
MDRCTGSSFRSWNAPPLVSTSAYPLTDRAKPHADPVSGKWLRTLDTMITGGVKPPLASSCGPAKGAEIGRRCVATQRFIGSWIDHNSGSEAHSVMRNAMSALALSRPLGTAE